MAAEQANESVVRKIQLLFQLAQQKFGNDGQSNENEAAAAMAKAQELLAKYNLDMAMVQSSRVEGGTALKEDKREEVKSQRTAMYRWQVKLCKAICEANFCWHWVVDTIDEYQISGGSFKKHDRPRRVKRHVILGREDNTKVSGMMYEYLVDTIEKLVPFKGAERLSRSANSWREGCADRLIERIEEKTEAMKKANRTDSTSEAPASTAITVQGYFEKEYAANYDARYGAGAYARAKAREAKREVEYKEREQQMKEKEKERQRLLANETPAQRAKREREEAKEQERQRKASERYWRSEDRKEEQEAMRRDHSAYHSGRRSANDIGLDSQIGTSDKNKLG
jgi:hypothetical protein